MIKDRQRPVIFRVAGHDKGMGQYIEPAILPSFMHDLEPGSKCEVCGWGNTNSKPGEYTEAKSLKCVELPIISTQRCNAPNSYAGAIHEDIMCVGYMTGGQDSCQV
ncbi:unnamed protein product, partial [Oikopleura dioica]